MLWNELYGWPMVTKLRMVRALSGCSRREMADYLQVSLTTYGRWERGDDPLPYREWQRVNELLRESTEAHERVELERRESFYRGDGQERYVASSAGPIGRGPAIDTVR